jgi:hypothetical protein
MVRSLSERHLKGVMDSLFAEYASLKNRRVIIHSSPLANVQAL